MTHAEDARMLTNRVLKMNPAEIQQVADTVRNAAMQAAAHGAHSLTDPIPPSIGYRLAVAAYATLARDPFAFRVTSERLPEGTERWLVSW